MSEEHVKVMLYNLLCSINYLHNLGLIHRDIKPGNILINQDCTIKICDFGFARGLPDQISKEESVFNQVKKQKLTLDLDYGQDFDEKMDKLKT